MSVRFDSMNAALPVPATERPLADTKAAAQALEAYFLRQVLAEVHTSSESALFGGGFAGSTFHEMLNAELAESMSKSGGIGLSKMLEQGFAPTPGGLPGLPELPNVQAPGRLAAPISAVTSSPFGRRTDPIDGTAKYHAGLDLAADAGTPVRSAGAGVVVRAEQTGGYGRLVVVDHGDGLETRYAHMQQISVKVGDRVGAGREVGRVGSTGRSTGPHLHFEVRRNGKAIDPTKEISNLKNPEE